MKKRFRAPHPGRILLYALLILAAVLVLLPIVLTFLYSFFPPTEIAAYLKTRNNYSADQFMDLLLSPARVSLRQYYTVLIEKPMYLNLFVNSAKYTAAILLYLSMPLVLGSWISFAVLLPYPAVIVRRIRNEEAILKEGLAGYRAYQQKVKYRLIPCLW